MTTVNTTGIDRATLLAALYNRAKPQGLGFLHYDPTPMTPADAQVHLDEIAEYEAEQRAEYAKDGVALSDYVERSLRSRSFDYLKGRVMKIDVAPDDLDPRLFDRDNGEGAVAGVVATLRG